MTAMSSSNKQFLAIRIDPELLASIDAITPPRGRTKWIEQACRDRLAVAPAEAIAVAEAKITVQLSDNVNPADAAVVAERVTTSIVGSVAGGNDGEAGHTLNPEVCAHIVLGIPRENTLTGETVRDCRGCGTPIVR